MIKDIHYPEVKDIAVAVVKEDTPEGVSWTVYLLNLKEVSITSILVSSKGYGLKNGEEVKTSTLRHFIDNMPAKSYATIEPIMEDVFSLSNEYWVSFYVGNVIHDKKFIFLPETISEQFLTNVPVINKKGVMIL
jgi:hypothetical protein